MGCLLLGSAILKDSRRKPLGKRIPRFDLLRIVVKEKVIMETLALIFTYSRAVEQILIRYFE